MCRAATTFKGDITNIGAANGQGEREWPIRRGKASKLNLGALRAGVAGVSSIIDVVLLFLKFSNK